ncbi:Na(+)/H(+) antiporter subunit F1 [Natribacillus halophilus]|uniref:Multisubunit sodium/proton antiporter, MrpF subunit n=1 Tax=Natribacillus halophilus TaxID=549003 RepID=A0A1G8QG05_9BACI|nr:Na(+)/H(+) antiporter subunit F1 [Natribacillus halophilus]SDJ03513.1 multisubunit sodium/proton antiporter, MrpF subunit [Natribacillus halophilus]
MFETVLLVMLFLLAIAILGGLYRAIKGPSMADRVIALDLISIMMIALIGVVSIYMETDAFLEAILLLGILAFIGAVAFGKYIERGVIIERKRDD